MVIVSAKELLSSYLITLKLRETFGANLPKTSTSTSTDSAGLLLDQQPHHHQPQDLSLRNQHQDPASTSVHVVIPNDKAEIKPIEEGRPDERTPSRGKPVWIISIRDSLNQARQDDAARSWSKVWIYRIPHYLRDGEDRAYIPQIVSLGPYHHGRKRFGQMDRHKWRALHRVLRRTRHNIKLYLDAVNELEEKARACYDGQIALSRNKFTEMMVLYGCFILELFRGVEEGFEKLGYPSNDPVFSMTGSMHRIQRDMIMLENQIPMFILDRLLVIQLGDRYQKRWVEKLALGFLDPLNPTDESLTQSDRNKLQSSRSMKTFDPFSDCQSELHCLELFRRSLLSSCPKHVPRNGTKPRSNKNWVADKRRQQLIHCVTELREAGIKFRMRKTDRFWDIEFKNGVLHIPRILIHHGTQPLFLNLIAFEQSHFGCSNEVTTYAVFMDNLINSPEDVGYLHNCGIIEPWLGSNAEVADLFNRLCQEVVFDISDSYLSTLFAEVNQYYGHPWNAWRASLKHKHFSNPWAIISLIAAVVLLLLTGAQTFYGVYGYYRPASS
ncbi:UPF0481 protein At3g47200-like [Punica granatum]|uniref:Uncharacterized protein n=2 Tax=Punica granatum TaxID=22663 RepID=A0A2I0HP55_PUNGR|nr:UPF0481 protein At3g47200-like [Punica granatum]PKI33343.1 hypothetical protein CRG98_046263 [Punica granatum]